VRTASSASCHRYDPLWLARCVTSNRSLLAHPQCDALLFGKPASLQDDVPVVIPTVYCRVRYVVEDRVRATGSSIIERGLEYVDGYGVRGLARRWLCFGAAAACAITLQDEDCHQLAQVQLENLQAVASSR
jgi:hypothetical protein